MNLAQRPDVLESRQPHGRFPDRFIHGARDLDRPSRSRPKIRIPVDSGNQQMISGAGTGNIEQVPLGVVDFLQIGVVADCLDASCKGIISSLQAITTTARNSRPLARCMVLIETCSLVVSKCSSRILKAMPASLKAARARSSCAADRTNRPRN